MPDAPDSETHVSRCTCDGWNSLYADSRERGERCPLCRGTGELVTRERQVGPVEWEVEILRSAQVEMAIEKGGRR